MYKVWQYTLSEIQWRVHGYAIKFYNSNSYCMTNRFVQYGKNLALYFGASLLPMLLNIAINPLMALNMSPSDYAVYGYYTSFTTLIGPVIVFYLVHYYIKEYFRRDEKERKVLKAIIARALIVFSGFVSLICFCALFLYLSYIKKDFSMPIMPYLALMVFALPLTGLLSLEQAQYRMDRNAAAYCRITIVNGVLAIILSLVFVVFIKWGAFGKLLATLLCNASIFVFILYKCRDLLYVKVSITQFKPILVFCFPLALSAMLGYFNHGFSTTYLESLNDTERYGVYVVGVSIGTYLTTFSTAINNTFQPDLYEAIAHKWWKRYIKVCLAQISLISFIVICFIVVAPFVIAILTANRYVDSTPYAQIMSVTAITSSIYYIINNFSIATNHPKLYLLTTIIGSIMVVCVMPFAVDKYLFIGGAWVTVLSYVFFSIVNIILLFLVRKNTKLYK